MNFDLRKITAKQWWAILGVYKTKYHILLLLGILFLCSCETVVKNNAPQLNREEKSNDWVFVSTSDPSVQYAIDSSTAVKDIGLINYRFAKILPTADAKGTHVYIDKVKVLCAVNSRALLKMTGFDATGNKVEEFVGSWDFTDNNPPSEFELKVRSVACGVQTDGSVREQLKTLSSSASKNPEIQKVVQNVLFSNKYKDE